MGLRYDNVDRRLKYQPTHETIQVRPLNLVEVIKGQENYVFVSGLLVHHMLYFCTNVSKEA
jgi:hypothetical protein